MVDESIVRAVRSYLQGLVERGLVVSFGVVIGSRVHTTADRWSDIDLLVVSSKFDAMRSRRDIDLLWRVAARTDSRIEPIPCGERQWQEDSSSPIVEIARREGQRISV